MNLLLDEDMQSRMLIRLLRSAGHDVETVSSAGIAGEADETVLALAVHTERVLVTRNGGDFQRLHQVENAHYGILVEYRNADESKNMTRGQIVAAIGKIEASGWSLAGELVSINAWR